MSKQVISDGFRELKIAGGLIADPTIRPQSLLPVALNLGLDPATFTNATAQAIGKAAILCDEQALEPTIENLVATIINQGLLVPAHLDDDSWRAFDQELRRGLAAISADGTTTDSAMTIQVHLILEGRDSQQIKAFWANVAPKITGADTGTATQVWEAIDEQWQKLRPAYMEDHSYTLAEQMAFAEEITAKQRAQLGKKLLSWPLAFDAVSTTLMSSLEKGNLYVVSGFPGSGKSSALDQVAEHNCRAGFKVDYFHLEDSTTRKLWRRCCRLTGASWGELKGGDPRGKMAQMNKLVAAWLKAGGDLVYHHVPGWTAKQIHQLLRRAKRKPDLVIIDYGQQLALEGNKNDSEFVTLGKAIKTCKLIAEDPKLDCAVILGSQMSSEKVEGWGSAGFKQFAQGMILLERKMITDPAQEEKVGDISLASVGQQSSMITMKVVKSNDGSLGQVDLYFGGPLFSLEGPEYRAFKDQHPDEEMPLPTLNKPTEAYLRDHDNRVAAWKSTHRFIKPKQNEPVKSNGGNGNVASRTPKPVREEVPYDIPF